MKKANRKNQMAVLCILAVLIMIFAGCSGMNRLERKLEKKADRVEDILENKADTIEQKIEDAIEKKVDSNVVKNEKLSAISEAEAKKIALEHAGVDEADAEFIRCKLDDGRKYDIEFVANGVEYDYDVLVADGKVISAEKEIINRSDKPVNAPAESKPSAKPELIGADKAKSIALNHAGVVSADRIKCELDDGRKYEVDFVSGGMEYEYDIDAVSGEILRSEKELRD